MKVIFFFFNTFHRYRHIDIGSSEVPFSGSCATKIFYTMKKSALVVQCSSIVDVSLIDDSPGDCVYLQ